jgi:hypothetical protein
LSPVVERDRSKTIEMVDRNYSMSAGCVRQRLAALVLAGVLAWTGCAAGQPRAVPTGTLDVSVLNHRGEPLPGLTIQVERVEGGGHAARAITADGTSVIRGLAPGRYRVWVLEHEAENTNVVQVHAGRTAEITTIVRVREPYVDHLDPVDRAMFATYDRRLRTVFAAAFRDDVVVQMMSRPSFKPEWVAGIRRTAAGQYRVFRLEASIQVWIVEHDEMVLKGEVKAYSTDGREDPEFRKRAAAGPKLEDIKAPEISAPIDEEVALAVIGAWKTALDQVNPPGKADLGLDGVTYEFLARDQAGVERRAEKWSPLEGSRPGRLVALAGRLGSYAMAQPHQRAGLLREILMLARVQ